MVKYYLLEIWEDPAFKDMHWLTPTMLSASGYILGDKTMDIKLMYTLNHIDKNPPFCRL